MKSFLSTFSLHLLLVSLLALSGCVTNGIMKGRSSGQAVQLYYHHSFWKQNGVINVTMPSGEHVTGKFVVNTSSSTGLAVGVKSKDAAIVSTGGNTSTPT